jgi:homoserine kinase type II
LLGRLTEVIAGTTAELATAAAEIRGRLQACAPERDGVLPRGIIHGDLFRENVLWDDGRLVAMVDFECSCDGPFSYDLMVCVLSWCFGASFEWPLVRGMLEGYMSRRTLCSREMAALGAEGAWACLRFATTRLSDFSMRAGPEGPKRDYRRFLQRLAELDAGASAELTSLAMEVARGTGRRRSAIGTDP